MPKIFLLSLKHFAYNFNGTVNGSTHKTYYRTAALLEDIE